MDSVYKYWMLRRLTETIELAIDMEWFDVLYSAQSVATDFLMSERLKDRLFYD